MSYATKTILGIDPGTAIVGFGVIAVNGQNLRLVAYGCITTPAKTPQVIRLKHIYNELKDVIKKYQPDQVAVEQLFFYNNAKTALTVGEARGVILLAAAQNKLPVREFTPLQVKQAVSCYGKASKSQVQRMVKLLLNLSDIPKPDDAADALAVAIAGANSATLYDQS